MILLPPLKNRRAILIVFLLLLLLPVLRFTTFIRTAPGRGKISVIFNFKGGVTFRKITEELAGRSIITSPLMFTLYARLSGKDGKVKAGYYQFTDGMTPRDILRKLVDGDVYLRPFVLPEGYSIFQAAELLEQQGLLDGKRFLAHCTDRDLLRSLGIPGQSAEGYLVPGTYNIEPDMDESGLITAMVGQFMKKRRATYEARLNSSGKNWHEVLTLASMIEKEAVIPAERPVIASVFYNRLARGMRLQSDPTSVYGVRAFAGKVTRADILRPSSYNTYLVDGLPPGPIGNPGDSAIEAALHPPRTSYLYFVARQDGSHHFSTTLDEHNRAVQIYLK
jgi:UPF0755 protein